MSEDRVVVALEQLMQAIDLGQDITRQLVTRVREAEARTEELAGDVAELGSRVSELERASRGEHSLSVVGRERFRTLEELAAVLRAELAEEVASIDKRITAVHDPALRALTSLVERKTPA